MADPSRVVLTQITADGACRPLPWQRVTEQIDAAQHAGRKTVTFVGHEPTRSPHLVKAVAAATNLGLRTILETNGLFLDDQKNLKMLINHGLSGICFEYDPAAPSNLVLEGLANAQIPNLTRILKIPLARSPEVAELARQHGTSVIATGPTTGAVEHAQIADELARACADADVPFETNVAASPATASGSPSPLSVYDPGFAARGLVTPRLAVGWTNDPSPLILDERLQLAAQGAPDVNAPFCQGGTGKVAHTKGEACEPCPIARGCGGSVVAPSPLPAWSPPSGMRIQVHAPYMGDVPLICSTLPALVQALNASGAQASLHTPWDLHWHEHDMTWVPSHPWWQRAARWTQRWVMQVGPLEYAPPPGRLPHPLRGRHLAEMDEIAKEHYQTLDLSETDVVVVPGFDHAARLMAHPTCGPDTRIVVADFHMLDGIDSLPKQWDRLVIHSCFPRFAHVYRTKKVPLERVLWRPYPIHPGHYPSVRRPGECDTIFAGGRHRRADETLLTAATHLPPSTHEISFLTNATIHATASPHAGPIRPRPTVEFMEFLHRLGDSRFAIVPLHPSPKHAAGITGVALAQAMGRPVVATASGGTVDHCRHGVDSLLVDPHDDAALAAAIHQLDSDPALLEKLSAGAARAAMRASVATWADEILGRVDPGPRIAPSGVYNAW